MGTNPEAWSPFTQHQWTVQWGGGGTHAGQGPEEVKCQRWFDLLFEHCVDFLQKLWNETKAGISIVPTGFPWQLCYSLFSICFVVGEEQQPSLYTLNFVLFNGDVQRGQKEV